MAHVTVELRDAPEGTRLATLDPVGSDIGAVLPDFDDPGFPLLRLVDPYGDTFFSAYQITGVLAELRRLNKGTTQPVLDQVIQMAEQCKRTPHSYLVFIGD